MIISTKRSLGAALAGAIALTATLSTPQPAMAQYTVAGAPGVANVGVVQGDVVIVRGDSGEQVAASINAPLLPGDYISTAGSSRSEIQFDGISMLRLAQDTQVRLVNLNPRTREMQVAAGTVELAELQSADGNPQIDTPTVTVRPNRAGDYRVSVLPNGQTLVTVRSGSATVAGATGTQILTPGTTLVAYGPYSNPSLSSIAAIAYDAFDTFNANRNSSIVTAWNSDQYLAPQLSGYANLAQYGQWYNVPGYGEAWAPTNQANDWSPYSNGQWVWEPGYGYTWVGNEQWGYAPYHYGNWFYANNYNQWMWQPPAYQYQTNPDVLASSWLPALVGFFLTGGNGGVSNSPYGYGNIGWVPLAPGEPYNPWYPGFGYGARYPQYGVGNVTNVYNIYRNIRYVRIVRMYPFERFRDGDWHRPILMHPDQLGRVGVLRGSIPIVPTRQLMRTGQISVKRPIVLSPEFRAQRFASRQPEMATSTFAKSQAALAPIAGARPKPVALPEHPPVVMHPEYRPPAAHTTYHAPVVTAPDPKIPARPVETMRPARPVETMRPARPVETSHPMETMHPVRSFETTAPRPVRTMAPVHTMPPVYRPAPMRTAAPADHVTPAYRPAPVHLATPAAHPPERTPQAQVHKAAATPAPENRPKPEKTPRPGLRAPFTVL